ncbi:hypothetical protein KP509_24G036100 [Ceratopteris richardii]|uniref:Uncharacterized protein n=1 Tax=Ceratopteris richardii TaxID=49495 RepID=A0A8T2RWS6_CERRI|nr:hypothetical protein KP509_24G036100 [Ceratopteris richardii]
MLFADLGQVASFLRDWHQAPGVFMDAPSASSPCQLCPLEVLRLKINLFSELFKNSKLSLENMVQ